MGSRGCWGSPGATPAVPPLSPPRSHEHGLGALPLLLGRGRTRKHQRQRWPEPRLRVKRFPANPSWSEWLTSLSSEQCFTFFQDRRELLVRICSSKWQSQVCRLLSFPFLFPFFFFLSPFLVLFIMWSCSGSFSHFCFSFCSLFVYLSHCEG